MVVLGVALMLLGSFFVGLRVQIDVNGSLNPRRSAFTYGLSLLSFVAGLAVIAWFSPCRYLSAWLIGLGVYAVTLASSIVSKGWGYVIPELHPIGAAVVAAFVVMLIVAWVRPTCG